MKKLFAILALCFMPAALYAVCPLCTVFVGVGLEGMRLLGINDFITGIWAGGLMLSVIFWTAGYMKRKGVQNGYWYLLMIAIYYAMLAAIWWLPDVHFGAETLWGIDNLLFGIIVGTVAFYIGARWHMTIKRKNGGKSWFKFQKVIWPLGALAIATLLFAAILNLSGQQVIKPKPKPDCPNTIQIEQVENMEH